MTETKECHAQSNPVPGWRHEPFRILFPLGVLLGWIGVGHWFLYTTGVTATYSCLLHGMVQMQAFMMAFATGFLLTALPRRTSSPPPSVFELAAIVAALCGTTAAALLEHWAVAELCYTGLFLILLLFAGRRFLGRSAGRRPPAAFALIPVGILHGMGGAGLIVASTLPQVPPWPLELGRLLIEQGVFLCFAVGVGSLILPLMSGMPPPPDLDASPRERWKAAGYFLVGLAIFASLVLEQLGWTRFGPTLRAFVVASGLGLGAGAWHTPAKPGLHRRLVWIAVWLIPTGLFLTGILPDYRVPAMHVVFIGGFSLLAFGVATHVTMAHLGLEREARGRPLAVAILGAAILLAMTARVAADWSETYFVHIGWAAGIWIAGTAIWLGYLWPRLVRR